MPKFYELILFVIAIFSFILYGMVVWVIYKYRKTEFMTPFFAFLINLGVFDMVRTVIWISTNTFPRWGWFSAIYKDNNTLAMLAMLTQWFFGLGQRVNNALLAANRFTAIVMPIKHLTFWSINNRKRNVIIGTWVLSFILFQAHTISLQFGYQYKPMNGTNGMAPDMAEGTPEWFFMFTFLFMFGSNIFTTLWYVVCYGGVLIGAIKMAMKNNNNLNQVVPAGSQLTTDNFNFGKEIRLSLGCFVLALNQISPAIYLIMIITNREALMADMATFYERWYVIFLCDSLSNPWVMLMMSSKVREMFKKTYWRKQQTPANATVNKSKPPRGNKNPTHGSIQA